MIERICTKILDILQADSRLNQGGSAFADGWNGVVRETDGDTPQAGYISLFDKSYDNDGSGHRPAIYVGSHGLEATDTEDFPTCNSGKRIEHRVLMIPFIVCVQAPTKNEARRQRNQLRFNIKQILLTQIRQDGYWYELTLPGGTGGMTSERVWTTGTGGAAQQTAEAVAAVPVQVRYSWSAASQP
jgi:hypothetical protein